jgi:hypothetical protein
MELNQDFKEFIQLLNEKQVEYLVVGGYAVAFHGYPRYTGDIDIWIAISKENAEKVMQVLKDFGFGSLAISEEDFLKQDLVIQLGYEPIRIDILTSLTALSFAECYDFAVLANLDDLLVKFINLENLKKNKLATGRQKDLGDVENLPEK